MNDMELVEIVMKQEREMYNLGKKHEALEIKSELLRFNFNKIDKSELIAILDKHISELKGENNE